VVPFGQSTVFVRVDMLTGEIINASKVKFYFTTTDCTGQAYGLGPGVPSSAYGAQEAVCEDRGSAPCSGTWAPSLIYIPATVTAHSSIGESGVCNPGTTTLTDPPRYSPVTLPWGDSLLAPILIY
jgi:hypothetical protein